MCAAVSEDSQNLLSDQDLARNLEDCDLDLDFSTADWNADYSTFDDYCIQSHSFGTVLPSLASDSYPAVSFEIPSSVSSQHYLALDSKEISISDPSPGCYDLQCNLQGTSTSLGSTLASCYDSETQHDVFLPDVDSSYNQLSLTWNGPNESVDTNPPVHCDSPELDVTVDSEWDNVGGTNILYKLVPECSKELLNLFKLPGQAKRRRYLTVRDMLNIKDKLSRIRSALNDPSVGCLSPTSLFTIDSNLTAEEVISLDGTDTQGSSVMSPPEDWKMIESSVNVPAEPVSQPKKLRSDRVQRRNFIAKSLDSEENSSMPPACNVTESTEQESLDTSRPTSSILSQPGSFTVDDIYKRPRHFDFAALQIGSFQLLADLVHTSQLCRLKVIFTSQKFVYEYEIPPRIPLPNKDLVLVTRVISIEVPFSTVTALCCYNNALQLMVNTRPFAFVGYRSSFPGQSKCCVYERNADNDITDGELGRSPVHRIVFTKPEAATRLKFYLISCHPNFSKFLKTPFPDAAVFSQMPLRDHTNFIQNPAPKPEQVESIAASSSPVATDLSDKSSEKMPSVSMCSCKVSCRSKRCSCARQGKPCQNCRCIGCENPLNILQNLGVNITWAQSVPCLMNSIYLLNSKSLKGRLQQKQPCPSCGTMERIADILKDAERSCCSECSVRLGYSWCKDQFFLACENTIRHCDICRRCMDCIRTGDVCPRCYKPFSPESSNGKHDIC